MEPEKIEKAARRGASYKSESEIPKKPAYAEPLHLVVEDKASLKQQGEAHCRCEK